MKGSRQKSKSAQDLRGPVPQAPSPLSDSPISDFQEIKALVGRKTKAILLTNPNNPTATKLTESEMRGICDIVKEVDDYIIRAREAVKDAGLPYDVIHLNECGLYS